ncbi:MAG: phosphoglucomutase/phosphomannomutase family protein [Armatimonadetes bacterium]|nr:phosphoglucomutase/phosphomannomutase family protein [Armatimonadota bacterium]
MSISFGTDGWRAVIAEDFTFENVALVTQAIANVLLSPERKSLPMYGKKGTGYPCPYREASSGLVVGFDTRFLSEEFAQMAAKVIAANGIPVHIADSPSPTPAVSHAVSSLKTAGALMITASHNPPRWNGIKFKPEYAGSALSEVTDLIEREIQLLLKGGEKIRKEPEASISTFDARGPYLAALRGQVDLAKVDQSVKKIIADPMYGASQGCVASFFKDLSIEASEIHVERNPYFGGMNPEPIGKSMEPLTEAVLFGRADGGFAFDGDGDRIGAVDEEGRFLNSHDIFSLLLRHLVQNKGRKGSVVKTFSTTERIRILADRFGLPFHETPIGFKHISDFMLAEDVLIGGEESGGIGFAGHIPERDGLLCALLLLEMCGMERKSLGALKNELDEEIGPRVCDRIDLHCEDGDRKKGLIESLQADVSWPVPGSRIKEVRNLDGVKYLLEDDSWILFRPSGTEPVVRIYAEARDHETVRALLAAGKEIFLGTVTASR